MRRARRRLDALKLANLRPDLLHEYLDQAQKRSRHGAPHDSWHLFCPG
ncbi:hypothetical protein GGI1_05640 [Acidithiobacillus sp. GGI-221]|nr:hypothetical protein GGI1_05640 [Acidithiobacillus sp. GGI-221]